MKTSNPNDLQPAGTTYSVLNWGPCVMRIQITDEFLNLLLKEGEASRVESQGIQNKLAGIMKEEYSFRDKNILTPYMAECIGVYDEARLRWSNKKPTQTPQYNIREMWINYMKKNEFNPPHDHSDTLSFVVYLKVPEEIKKEQEEYKGKSSGPGGISFLYGEGTRQAITYQAIMPREKDMWIFPAWVKHYVAPFSSDVTRISVAGNITDTVPLASIKEGIPIYPDKK